MKTSSVALLATALPLLLLLLLLCATVGVHGTSKVEWKKTNPSALESNFGSCITEQCEKWKQKAHRILDRTTSCFEAPLSQRKPEYNIAEVVAFATCFFTSPPTTLSVSAVKNIKCEMFLPGDYDCQRTGSNYLRSRAVDVDAAVAQLLPAFPEHDLYVKSCFRVQGTQAASACQTHVWKAVGAASGGEKDAEPQPATPPGAEWYRIGFGPNCAAPEQHPDTSAAALQCVWIMVLGKDPMVQVAKGSGAGADTTHRAV